MALAAKSVQRPTPTIHHKKRTGSHQKQSKSFIKTYWPYMPLFGIGAVVVIVLGAKVLGLPGAIIGSVSVTIAGISFIL